MGTKFWGMKQHSRFAAPAAALRAVICAALTLCGTAAFDQETGTNLTEKTDAKSYVDSGNAWYDKKDYDRAIADYTEAIRIDPEYSKAYNGRGIAYDNKCEYDNAIEDCNEAIRINPEYVHAYNNRGAPS